jgi:flagellar motor switch protein FliM
MEKEEKIKETAKKKERFSPMVVGSYTGAEIIASSHPKDKKITVKQYDFRRPDKFSRDQLRTLAIIHETFSRLATTRLITMLRQHSHLSMGIAGEMGFSTSYLSRYLKKTMHMTPAEYRNK